MGKGSENSSFYEDVYGLVARIPLGKVMTYGQIARLLERRYSARFVGFAMAAAPEDRGLPCHRVVNAKGEMSPGFVFGGEDVQRACLKKEGVPFLASGKIDLRAALFEPDLDY